MNSLAPDPNNPPRQSGLTGAAWHAIELQIAKLSLQPSDIVILRLTSDEHNTPEFAACAASNLKQAFPNNRLVLLTKDMDMAIVRDGSGLMEIFPHELGPRA